MQCGRDDVLVDCDYVLLIAMDPRKDDDVAPKMRGR